MGRRRGPKLPAFCVNRIRPLVRVRSPPLSNKPASSPIKLTQPDDQDDHKSTAEIVPALGRKIMVVVDSSAEAKAALTWALTHSVQSHDTVVLLYASTVHKPDEETNKKMSPKVYELLHSMKKTCQAKRPEVQVEITVVHGKEKGPAIVEEARKQGVSLLVLGQKKRSTTWRLLLMWAGSKLVTGGNGGGVAEYCIKNADCMAIAVRKKSQKVGGYLITTKRHKDFWLLA